MTRPALRKLKASRAHEKEREREREREREKKKKKKKKILQRLTKASFDCKCNN